MSGMIIPKRPRLGQTVYGSFMSDPLVGKIIEINHKYGWVKVEYTWSGSGKDVGRWDGYTFKKPRC
jgi:hypothetical protein